MKWLRRLILYNILLFSLCLPSNAQNILGREGGDIIATGGGDYIRINYGFAVTANDVTISYALIDCEDAVGQVGLTISGTGFIGNNITIVRCPGGGFVFNEDAALKNTIVYTDGDDISIAAGKTVTGTTNLFGDAAKAGAGTYTDVAGTQWNTNPLFISGTNFKLLPSSPAKNAGTPIVGLTSDYAGRLVPQGTAPDIGAYEYWPVSGGLGMGGRGMLWLH